MGRWHTIDPLDEYLSPYIYLRNNPIKLIDPDGMGENDSNSPDVIDQFLAKYDNSVAIVSEGLDIVVNLMSFGAENNIENTGKVVGMVAEHGMPDMISLYAFGETAYGIGSYHEFAGNWLTNGLESGFMPYPTYTGGFTAGWGTAGVGVGFRLGWSLGDVSMKSYLGHGSMFAGGTSLGTSPFSISGDLGFNYNVERLSWVTASSGIGLSVPGVGYYYAQTYTVPLYKEK